MTNNDAPLARTELNEHMITPPIARLIDSLQELISATAISTDEDPIDLIFAITDKIMLQNDLCPIHRCDFEICADDQEIACADLRR